MISVALLVGVISIISYFVKEKEAFGSQGSSAVSTGSVNAGSQNTKRDTDTSQKTDIPNVPKPKKSSNWEDNVLMRDKINTVIPLGSYRSSIESESVFGSSLTRWSIRKVVFENSVANAPKDFWDVSQKQDGSVIAWAIPCRNMYDREMYELHIAAEGGVNGELACQDLFCGYANLEEVVFNNCFHTETAEDMSRMFYGCRTLEYLDEKEIRTDNAENLSEMFSGCFGLKTLHIGSWETSKVQDMSGMFCKCSSLQNLSISGWNTFNVRDVSYMFYECASHQNVEFTDDFWFRNVDRYANHMNEGAMINGEPWEYYFGEKESLFKDLRVGDVVFFGAYEQDNNKQNGKESIEWEVLAIDDGHAFLISRYGLDCSTYHDTNSSVTWENCSLRNWLNGTFYNSAFSVTEKNLIVPATVLASANPKYNINAGNNTQDKLILLSIAEVNATYPTSKSCICAPTQYAIAQGAYINSSTGGGWWWLRTPGNGNNTAASVNSDGTCDYDGSAVNAQKGMVRPGFWVKVN